MNELFTVLAAIYIAFVIWYIVESSVCSWFGHDYVLVGYTKYSIWADNIKYTGKHPIYKCERCGKKLR